MSEIISNKHVEDRMTKKFVYELYLLIQGKSKETSIDPIEIWKNLGYNAFHENVIPIIVSRLITNNVENGLVGFDEKTNKVNLTPRGFKWCEHHSSEF